MRTVLFGGTFDPWTSAHQEIVERLSSLYDKVIVIPTNIIYYKGNNHMFSFDERFKMAVENVNVIKQNNSSAVIEVNDIERNVDKNWRFIHTLKKIIEGSQDEFFYAIGSDSLQRFTSWYEWEEILKRVKLVVFNRPGYTENLPDIPYELLPMNNPVSSTQVRKTLGGK